MKYGCSFDGTHTSTWKLEQTAPAEIGSPSPRLYQVEIPGYEDQKTGSVLDLTENFFGRTSYDNRLITIQFVCRAPRSEWPALRAAIASEIHGQVKKVVFDDDRYHYWHGRSYLESWNADNRLAYPVITIEAAPFKWDSSPTTVSYTISGAASTQTAKIDGTNVSKQDWNTDFRYGSQALPAFDFSPYSVIEFHFTAMRSAVTIQLIDGAGTVYNIESTGEKGARVEAIPVKTLIAAGIDPSTIWRILFSMGADGMVLGKILGVTVPVHSGVRAVDVTATVPAGVQYLRYGTDVFPIVGGFNSLPGVQLLPGSNDLVFTSDLNFPSSGEIEVSYRKGWL